MAKLVMLFALCVLPALAVATRPMRTPFTVEGKVYCDACRFGYESSATTYIAGAKVRVECKDKLTMALRYSKEGTTDSTGTYRITVAEDHEDQICDSILVSSPQKSCSEATPGRDRARVILTGYNGIASYNRLANAMGFMRTEAVSGCSQILKQMQELDV
ncbi:protein DOWNSTREAM OF FLC [Rosa rugosa]|uniref:Putative pollen allergen Ole e 1 family n=1 Tax=Rosa chinensis TaxID=74649 RepID=A0A2P6PHU2_ROSCH|nr:protein DOWNSTREAM OF FLC [Rosa chinensis]XP_062029698.1 protein DOWNSTREAM OF FLC [Rosa rugosa]PRQ21501.1 putative pollen allergen Ole e 1 family [Rosa chinensis]